MTYVDTKISIGNALGSILTMVLLFGRTVLLVKWWKRYIFSNSKTETRRQQQREQLQSQGASMTSSHPIIESESYSSVQVQKLPKWNDLINKKVVSCEMVDIGYVSKVEPQFMTIILTKGSQEYVIPTYYIREYNQERVLMDTSVRYLDRYETK